jgi:hypothetical protein
MSEKQRLLEEDSYLENNASTEANNRRRRCIDITLGTLFVLAIIAVAAAFVVFFSFSGGGSSSCSAFVTSYTECGGFGLKFQDSLAW